MNNPRGLCIDCNYSLAGIDSTRCPECGRPFDPGDPSTMNMTGPIASLERSALKPSVWLYPVTVSAMAIITAICLWTIPWTLTGVLGSILALCAVSLATVILLSPSIVLRRWVVHRHKLPAKFVTVDEPVIRRMRFGFCAAVVLLLTRLPFWMLFFVSLPALYGVANREYRQRPHDAPRPHDLWIGAFRIQNVKVGPMGVTFELWHGFNLHYYPAVSRDERRHLQVFFKDWYFDD